jgi:hypothetical protein
LYRLVSTPNGRWKEELKFPGFYRVRIGNGKQFAELQDPTTPIPIPIPNELDLLLNFSFDCYFFGDGSTALINVLAAL